MQQQAVLYNSMVTEFARAINYKINEKKKRKEKEYVFLRGHQKRVPILPTL
jgi:hypothetical protein